MADTATPAFAMRAQPLDHVVGFYETDAYLADAVSTFLAPAFASDGVAIVIATPDHHTRFATALAGQHIDVAASDRYLRLDAADTLASLLVDGVPDRDRFRSVIGELIDGHARQGRAVLAYGEMVALLWGSGDVEGALALEEMWSDLAATHDFGLLCGYPTSVFENDTTTDGFRAVIDAHTAVVPHERFASIADPDDQIRAVALLQQQEIAAANEREALRRKQEELEEALEQLTEADRIQRQFVAMVAHDIRNPTVVISGMLALLEEGWSEFDEEQARELLSTASRNATQIGRLLDDILLMSRLESGQFSFDVRPIALEAVVAEVVAETRRATGRTIHVAFPDRIRPALADEGRQVQVLNNLLSNATKFSPPGTIVSVTIEDRSDHLRVEVTDRGTGIAERDLGRLFRPFSRLSAAAHRSGGTGLGLFITKALVEGQGGAIDVESSPGAGTTFSYTVPFADAAR